MIFEPDERLKKKMAKNGSVLQFMYSVAGAGKGLITAGVMLIGIGALLAAALIGPQGTETAITVAAAAAVPGFALIILGIILQQKRERGWVSGYMKKTSLNEQELHQVDQEFRQPGTILFSLDKGKDTNSLKRMGFITANFVKFPGPKPCIFRLQDVVACLYTKKMLCADGGYDRALIAYGIDGVWAFLYTSPPEKASLEIVNLLKGHNPRIITDHHFVYEDREYDTVQEVEEVIALHKRVYGKRSI